MPNDDRLHLPVPEDVRLSFREYAKYTSKVVWVGDTPWRIYGNILSPLSMPHVSLDVDRSVLRKAMAAHKVLLACWTTEWDLHDFSEWWWVCCDRKIDDVAEINSYRGRRDIRKGLRECTVRRMEFDNFAPLAYPIYSSALKSYGEQPQAEENYIEAIEKGAAYPGTEFWAAFYGEKMAAFATCRIVDHAAILVSAKSAAAFHRYNPNAALFYTMAQSFLNRELKYVTNGWRTLWHPTRINKLFEKIGFRKVYCRVNVELSPFAKIVYKSHLRKWGAFVGMQRLLGKKWMQLEGFQKLVDIAKTFE